MCQIWYVRYCNKNAYKPIHINRWCFANSKNKTIGVSMTTAQIRNEIVLQQWPLHKQFAALVEYLSPEGSSTSIDALIDFISHVKETYKDN